MNADASIGFSRMGVQGADRALNLCGAEKFVLVRLVVTASHARPANKADISDRAEVGFSPCRTRGDPAHTRRGATAHRRLAGRFL